MTKEELAKQLDGKEYRQEISSELLTLAKQHGLVIIYCHSDDLMELEGALEDEGSCYHGAEFFIDSLGLLGDRDDMDDDELEEWMKRKNKAEKIEAVWCAEGEPSWTYKTDIPHATFNVIEGDGDTEIQCRGIVFNISDLPFAYSMKDGVTFSGVLEESLKSPEPESGAGKKVLITGGAGFLGSHVAMQCINLGMVVHVVDDLSGGFEENIPVECEWHPYTILDVVAINGLFERENFDMVFHLAADARENLSHFTAHHTYTNNLIGSVNIINACVNHNVRCLVFTSSIAVMANATPPYDEMDLCNPGDPYGLSKLSVERHLHMALHMFGLNHIIFRPFNIYGPGQNIGDRYRNVIGIFMNQIMNNQPLTIFGDGEQTRSFSYIDDVAPHIAKSVLRQELYNSTFFIGGAKQYSINELAHVVAAEFGVLPDIKYLEQRHEARTAYANTDKARSAFGPALVDLEEGIRRMAAWARTVWPRQSAEFKEIEIRKNLPEGW